MKSIPSHYVTERFAISCKSVIIWLDNCPAGGEKLSDYERSS